MRRWSWDYVLADMKGTPLPSRFSLSNFLNPLFPSLEEVDLSAFQRGQVPILSRVNRLRKLHISVKSPFWRDIDNAVAQEVVGAIERSKATLEVLLLHLSPLPIGSLLSDHQGQGYRFSAQSFPRLRSLSLDVEACIVMLPMNIPLPLFVSLQFLRLRPPSSGRAHDLQRVRDAFGMLESSSIRLRGVTAPASEALVRYIGSYENELQDVEVYDDDHTAETSRAALAEEFFNRAILRHAVSLKELMVTTQHDDGWAFGKSNDTVLLRPLPALESVAVSVLINNDPPREKDYLVSRYETPHGNYLSKRVPENLAG